MDRFDDKRINEALELLNAAARDKKEDIQTALANKYTDLANVFGSLTDQMRQGVASTYDAGKQKVVDVATDIDKSVHRNPWAYIGGTAAAGIVLGFLLGRSRRD